MLVKVTHYPSPNLPKIYHGCGVRREENGFNELIDRPNSEAYITPTHLAHWKFHKTKKHEVSNKRYLTRSFLKELREKELLYAYKPIMNQNVIKKTACKYLHGY